MIYRVEGCRQVQQQQQIGRRNRWRAGCQIKPSTRQSRWNGWSVRGLKSRKHAQRLKMWEQLSCNKPLHKLRHNRQVTNRSIRTRVHRIHVRLFQKGCDVCDFEDSVFILILYIGILLQRRNGQTMCVEIRKIRAIPMTLSATGLCTYLTCSIRNTVLTFYQYCT